MVCPKFEWAAAGYNEVPGADYGDGFCFDIAALPDGGSIMVGGFRTEIQFGDSIFTSNPLSAQPYLEDGFVAKADTSGEWEWAFQSTGVSRNPIIAVEYSETDQTVVVLGKFENSSEFEFAGVSFNNQGNGGFVAKIDLAGNVLWVKQLYKAWPMDLALRTDGGIVVMMDALVGTIEGDVTINLPTGHTFCLLHFSSVGQYVSNISHPGTDFEHLNYEKTHRLSIDESNNLLFALSIDETNQSWNVGGLNYTPLGSWDLVLAKINTSGAFEWGFDVSSTSVDQLYDLVMKGDTVVLSSKHFGSVANLDAFTPTQNSRDVVAYFDSNGNLLDYYETFSKVNLAYSSAGFYVAGFKATNKVVRFNNANISSGSHCFVAKVDNGFNLEWYAKNISTVTNTSVLCADVNENGSSIQLGGETKQTATFGESTIGGTQEELPFTASVMLSESIMQAPTVAEIACGEQVSIEVEGQGVWNFDVENSSDYSASYSNGNGIITGSPSSTEFIIISAEDACDNILLDTVDIIVNPNPVTPSSTTSSLPCGSEVELSASLQSPVLNTDFEWSVSSSTVGSGVPYADSPSTTTTYTVTATTPNGCESEDEITITVLDNPVSVSSSQNNIACGTQITLSAELDESVSGTTYEWSDGNITLPGNSSSIDVSPGETTTYTVVATTPNDCESTDQVTINVSNPNPPDPGIYSTTGNFFLCDNGLTISAASNFASYQWSTGATTQSITVNDTGYYSVQVYDIGGCAGTDSVHVIPMTEILTPGGTILCSEQSGQTLLLDAGSGFESYSWNTGEATQSIEVDVTGNYTCTITLNGCSYTANVEVTQNSGTATADFNDVTNGLTVSFEAIGNGISFVAWDFGDGNTSTELNPTHTYAEAGTYTVTLSLTDVCGNSASHSATISVSPIGVLERDKLQFNLYPNPSNGEFTIEFQERIVNTATVEIFGMLGTLVFQQALPIETESISFRISDFDSASYILKIESTDKVGYRLLNVVN